VAEGDDAVYEGLLSREEGLGLLFRVEGRGGEAYLEDGSPEKGAIAGGWLVSWIK
jgi:hypothetical protein